MKAIAPKLQMVTFDADDTIYSDGGSIVKDCDMTKVIVQLLQNGIYVSLVTAAGYPNQPERFEQRLCGVRDFRNCIFKNECVGAGSRAGIAGGYASQVSCDGR